MREIILDCKQLSHKSTAHQVISDAFGFPDYYLKIGLELCRTDGCILFIFER